MIIKKNRQNVEGIVSEAEVQPEQTQETEVGKVEVEAEVLPEKNQDQEAEISLFDLDDIDFKQRSERRRGDRRRGFRRVDDRNLVSRAKEEANAIRETAYKEGYKEGLSKAQEDISDLKSSLKVFANAKQEVYNEIAPDILEISIDIAKKIIKKEVSENTEILLDNIKNVLQNLSKEETKIMITVNPSQVALLKEKVPEQVSSTGLEAKVMIIPDENTTEGGCMVTTTNGVIDATIETQLEIISEALKEV